MPLNILCVWISLARQKKLGWISLASWKEESEGACLMSMDREFPSAGAQKDQFLTNAERVSCGTFSSASSTDQSGPKARDSLCFRGAALIAEGIIWFRKEKAWESIS